MKLSFILLRPESGYGFHGGSSFGPPSSFKFPCKAISSSSSSEARGLLLFYGGSSFSPLMFYDCYHLYYEEEYGCFTVVVFLLLKCVLSMS